MRSGPDTALDPQSQCERYTAATYERMRDDVVRTGAYERAIHAAAPGRVCLDIGTGAMALLAVMAAKAGASHVFAVEANSAAFAAAQRAVEAEGVADRVTLLHGYSTSIGTLPRRINLLLHEILGEVAGYEGVVAAVHDARRHLEASPPLSDEADVVASVSVPARATTLLSPCEFPSAQYFASLPHPMIAAPGARALKLPGLPLHDVALAPPQPFEDLRFEAAAPEPSQRRELRFVMARRGVLRGACVHIELRMSDGDAPQPDVTSAQVDSHWPNVLLLLRDEVEVAAGQVVVVRTSAELAGEQPRYEFEFLLEGAATGAPSDRDGPEGGDGLEGGAAPQGGADRLQMLGRVTYPE